MATAPAHELGRWQRRFFTIWVGQALSLLGSQLVQFGLVWYLTRQTGSATVLATATLVAMLPNIALAPLVGSLIDRGNRRRIMMVADSGVALVTVLLALVFAVGAVQLWHIYLAMFLRALGGAFHGPAMQASTSLMVPPQHLARIQGLNQMLNGGMNILSAPLGALLLELLPMQGLLGLDVLTALFAVVPLFFFTIPQPAKAPSAGPAPSFWQDVRAGLQYVLSWPGLLIICLMATAINFLFSPAGALTPLLITKHFGGGVKELGLFEAMFSAGVILGGLLLGAWGGFRRQILTAMLGLLGMGVFTFLVGRTPVHAFPWAVAGMFFSGSMNPIVNGSLGAILQGAVEPGMQGRVFSLINSLSTAVTPVSLLAAGPLADRYGVPSWYMLGGVVCFLLALVGLALPAVMSVDDGHPGKGVVVG